MRIGDHIMRIVYTSQTTHLLCWVYFRDFYGKMCWRSDNNYNIKIDNNRRRAVDSKKEKDILIIENLKKILEN